MAQDTSKYRDVTVCPPPCLLPSSLSHSTRRNRRRGSSAPPSPGPEVETAWESWDAHAGQRGAAHTRPRRFSSEDTLSAIISVLRLSKIALDATSPIPLLGLVSGAVLHLVEALEVTMLLFCVGRG